MFYSKDRHELLQDGSCVVSAITDGYWDIVSIILLASGRYMVRVNDEEEAYGGHLKKIDGRTYASEARARAIVDKAIEDYRIWRDRR